MKLTRKAFWDLAIFMVGFGLLVGVVFPPFVVVFGMPASKALTPEFFTCTLIAGFSVGAFNYALARGVVGRRIRVLSERMRYVDDTIRGATLSGDWSVCDPATCRLPVDSDDELGDAARAFNGLIEALDRSHNVLEQLATRDELTGVLNRRAGLDALERAFDQACAGGRALGVLMLDFDHFKSVNDTRGHAVGDRVLADAATALATALRDGDTLVRYGGEEFVAVLPGAGADDLVRVGARLRAAVHDVDRADGRRASVSVGGVSFPAVAATDIDELLARADEALYASKAAGRDRLTLAR
jgi:diguanylate cyclase (GGDEF)-like protein